MNQRLIVTEGERDTAFVGQLLSKFGIRRVKALPPSKAAAVGGDGWPNALSATRLTLMQMADGAVESLAIIVYADYAHSNGRGYRTVFAECSSLLSEFGYANPTRVGDGLVFRSNDGLRPVGLWTLPDTRGVVQNDDDLTAEGPHRRQRDGDPGHRERVVEAMALGNAPFVADRLKVLAPRWFMLRAVQRPEDLLLLNARTTLCWLRGPMTRNDLRRLKPAPLSHPRIPSRSPKTPGADPARGHAHHPVPAAGFSSRWPRS